MVLTLNVGNTHITMGGYENDKLLFSARLRTDPVGSSDEYAIKLEDLLRLNGRNRADVDGACLLYTSSEPRHPPLPERKDPAGIKRL